MKIILCGNDGSKKELTYDSLKKYSDECNKDIRNGLNYHTLEIFYVNNNEVYVRIHKFY